METPLPAGGVLAGNCVVSLPMRDGNVFLEEVQGGRCHVVSLPMRDGNQQCVIQ